jgi:hypothetical protein
MAQEMYKHDALLHLLWAVAKADSDSEDEKYGAVSSIEDAFYEKVKKAEGIDISFEVITDKRKELRKTIGSDGIIKEALKATNGCSKEWKAKVIVYMIKMANKSWEGRYTSEGDKLKISANESAIYNRAREVFRLTDEEEKKGWDLVKA